LSLRAEEIGYESVWTVEHNYGRDAVTPTAAIAYATSRVLIGNAVVPILTRSALLLATTYATLDELAGGRMIIGLGAGSRLLIEAQGIPFEKPVTALRENVELIRTLLRDGHATLHGAVVQHEGVEMDFEPLRREIPIWLGVTGPRALEVCGQIGDGVVLNAFTSVEYTRRAVELLAKGRAASNRPGDLAISTMVVCLVDERKAALDRMRPILALYLARLPDIAQQSGFEPELLDRLREEVRTEGAARAARLLSDEMVDHLTICGPTEFLHQRILEQIEAGVTHPLVFPIDNWAATLEAVASGLGSKG
jgi:Coenzyme F420-dependent N5,N10-methylene tetrahydromethanopterin reductase and related flavin-dependent oxidoreductases